MHKSDFGKFLIVAFGCISMIASAQVSEKNSCSQKLKEMQKNYEQGILSTIPTSLEDCMTGGFSRAEKLQAYRLVILTYLFLDEQKNAQKTMQLLLEFEPDYQPNRSLDPVEFIKLYESFLVLPFFSFGATIGVNQANVQLGTAYGVGNNESNPVKFAPGIGLNFGACLDILLAHRFFLSAEGYYYSKNFKSSQSILNSSDLSTSETQTSLNLPVALKFLIGKNKLKLFVKGGIAVDFLLSAQNEMIRKNTTTNQNDFAGPSLKMDNQRNKINLSALVGAGITYKLGYGFAFLDARFLYGLTNYSNINTRYNYFDTQVTTYGYIDPDFGINNIQINLGYMYSLYKVKKKRNEFKLE